MTTYRVDFEMQVNVVFEEPEKAKAYFIDGPWKKSFFAAENLSEIATNIANVFVGETAEWDREAEKFAMFLEGYGVFYQEGQVYVSHKAFSDAGEIRIEYEMELEEVWTGRVSEGDA